MKIGYPCINRTLSCQANKTFRLASYSDQKLQETIQNNLTCLKEILTYNIRHNLRFFRITSQLVPFASHPVCTFDWKTTFKTQFKEIGQFCNDNNVRISMHPDQFVLINAKDQQIINRSIAELQYHADVLNLMGLDHTAKIQIHVGGVYNDKRSAIDRFIKTYKKLPVSIQNRLVIENDDKRYDVKDCLDIAQHVQIPILFDTFHHECLNNGETSTAILKKIQNTWTKKDGIPMLDYSSQETGAIKGKHTTHIDIQHFQQTVMMIQKTIDADIMLEIKDKEKSALLAKAVLKES